MDYALLMPEINSGRMYSGPGSGPMLAAAAAWDSVAAQLESAAGGYFSEVSGLAGQTWFGPSSMRMAAAAAPYIAWLQAGAAQAAQTSAQAYAAAAAYEAAFAMTVPPPVIVANRTLKMALIATNFFGQNTPAIAATEAQYMEMWVQDATAMYTYAADSSVASTLTSYNEPPQTTNESGQVAQTRALAQTTANATSARTQTLVQMTQPAASQPVTTQPVTAPVSSGNVTMTSGVTINGGSDNALLQGSITGGGTINLAPGASLTVQQGASLIVNGTINVAQGSSITVGTGGTIDVESTTLTLGSGSAIHVGGSAAVSAQSAAAFSSALSGGGTTITIGPGSSGIFLNGAPMALANTSVTVSQGGSLIVSAPAAAANGSTLGASVTANGSVIAVGPGSSLTAASPVTINGSAVTVAANGNVALSAGAPITVNSGTISIPGGTATEIASLQAQLAAGGVTIDPVSSSAVGTSTATTTPGFSGLSSTLSAPGLAGNAGIQPQVDFSGFLDAVGK